jgi:glycosyltransferase involved in cell wall biosynthesis
MVPWKLMCSFYLKARAALVLYSPHPNHYVVRSNRFYQALATGLPVITSNFPRWKERVDSLGCGVAVDPTDPSSIAEAILFMYQHPDKAAKMGQRGRSLFVNKFNWNREEPRLVEFYERVLMGNVRGV